MDIQPRVNDGGTADVRLKVIDEFTKGCPNPEKKVSQDYSSVFSNYVKKFMGTSIFNFGTT